MLDERLAATYTLQEQHLLLALARRTLTLAAAGMRAPSDLGPLPPALTAIRACFVTLRTCGEGALRGCTGTLTARRPLAAEVVCMTLQTALHDPRFVAVTPPEVDGLRVEISVLTPPQPLAFTGPDDLLSKLQPGADGVTLLLGDRRATFLPSVWTSYGDPEIFLSLLAQKMGLSPAAWRDPAARIETYQAVVVEEPVIGQRGVPL